MSSAGSSTTESTVDAYKDNFSLTFSFFENKTVTWREDKRKISRESNDSEIHPLQTAKIVGSTCSKNLLVFAGLYYYTINKHSQKKMEYCTHWIPFTSNIQHLGHSIKVAWQLRF